MKRSKLLQHQATHDKPKFTCDNYDKIYTREDWFQKHLETCSEFSDQFPTFANVLIDEQPVHFKTEPIDDNNENYILASDNLYVEEPDESEHCTNNARRKRMERKTKSLSDVLQKLSSMAQSDKAKIIRNSFQASEIDIQNVIVEKQDLDEVNDAKMVVGVCRYLQNLNCKDSTNRNLFCSLNFEMFADEPLSNDQTLTWLSNKLGKKKATIENWLQKYILIISIPETRGRKNLPNKAKNVRCLACKFCHNCR